MLTDVDILPRVEKEIKGKMCHVIKKFAKASLSK